MHFKHAQDRKWILINLLPIKKKAVLIKLKEALQSMRTGSYVCKSEDLNFSFIMSVSLLMSRLAQCGGGGSTKPDIAS